MWLFRLFLVADLVVACICSCSGARRGGCGHGVGANDRVSVSSALANVAPLYCCAAQAESFGECGLYGNVHCMPSPSDPDGCSEMEDAKEDGSDWQSRQTDKDANNTGKKGDGRI